MRRVLWLGITLVCILPALISCSSETRPAFAQALDGGSPEIVARAFVEATNQSNVGAFTSLLTAGARVGLESGSGFELTGQRFEILSMGAATVTGGEAEIAVETRRRDKREQLTVRMRRIGESWKVYALVVTGQNGPTVTLDFELAGPLLASIEEGIKRAFERHLRGGSVAEIEQRSKVFQSITDTSDEDYRESWRNADSFEATTSGRALRELAAGLGLRLHIPPHLEPLLSEPVVTDVVGLSRLESIERIANALNLHAVYPAVDPGSRVEGARKLANQLAIAFDATAADVLPHDSEGLSPRAVAPPRQAITLQRGPREWPVAYSGPFLFTIGHVEENVPHATGNVDLIVRGYGLPLGVLGAFPSPTTSATLKHAVAPNERSLLLGERVHYRGKCTTTAPHFECTYRIGLEQLLRDVDRIHRIAGSQIAVLPRKVQEVEFSTPRKKNSRTVGTVTVTVQKNTGNRLEFALTSSGNLSALQVRGWAHDADGNDLGIVDEATRTVADDHVTYAVETVEPAETVFLKWFDTTRTITHPFELRSIPLTRYLEMPEALTRLEYGTHPSPLGLEFVALRNRDSQFPKIQLRAANHANKPALNATVQFVYVDPHGHTLKQFPHRISGVFSSDGPQAFVAPGESTELETTAFFIPNETDSVRTQVEEVRFVDGTSWKRNPDGAASAR